MTVPTGTLALYVGSPTGATLWVNSVFGNDSATRAAVRAGGGSIAWATIGRAAWGSTNFSSPNAGEAAEAGDVVEVAAGTYSGAGVSTYVGTNPSRYTPLYKCANTGSEGSPITFAANGVVTLETTSGQGAIIGALDQDYITWRGFTINEANAPSSPDTGPVVLWSTTGSVIEYCTITGDASYLPADNHIGIRCEHTQQVVIRHNEISYFYTGQSGPANGCGIETYWTGNFSVHNNYIHHCGTAIFLKANGDEGVDAYAFGPIDVYLNRVETVAYGIYFYRRSEIGAYKYRAYQNLLIDADYPFVVHSSFADGSDPRLAFIVNNTAVGANVEHVLFLNLVSAAGHEVKNNIFSGAPQFFASEGVDAVELGVSTNVDFNRNVYHAATVRFARLEDGAATNYADYAAWSAAIPQDANSITSDPQFVGSGSYKLQAGSPALVQGRVVDGIGGTTGATIPAGCYITGSETVGVA